MRGGKGTKDGWVAGVDGMMVWDDAAHTIATLGTDLGRAVGGGGLHRFRDTGRACDTGGFRYTVRAGYPGGWEGTTGASATC